jgi:hypothetical protein
MATQLEWQIIDDTGVIHSGTSDEMDSAWDVMTSPDEHSYYNLFLNPDKEFYAKGELTPEDLKPIWDKWKTSFTGDLKLIEVHKIHR